MSIEKDYLITKNDLNLPSFLFPREKRGFLKKKIITDEAAICM